jgi:hypothetical protein
LSKDLTLPPRQRVGRQQPRVPCGIPVDLAEIRHRGRDLLVEPVPGLDRQALAQLGIVGVDLLQLRRQGMDRSALAEIDEFGAVILHVIRCDKVGHRASP